MFEFDSRPQEAQSYRKAGFSYYQIADLMGISTKQVWMNLKSGEARDLTSDEMHSAVDKVGIPRGSVRMVKDKKSFFSQWEKAISEMEI